MALSILNNIASLAAQNNLTVTGQGLQTTLFRLSSGSRINSGADDAAGLAIADGLQANITGLTQSSRNANDGVGKLQVADGALAQVTTLLNRAVTLGVESATGTVSQAQRGALDAEFTAIKAEIDRIGTSTTFNGAQVFQSATQPNLNEQDSPAATTVGLTAPLTVNQTTTVSSGTASFTFTAATGTGINPNTETGSVTTLTGATALAQNDVVTLTRGSGTSIFTATNAATVGELETAINTGASTANITVTGTDPSHAGYAASLVGGALQVSDGTGQNDLTVVQGTGAELGAFSHPTAVSTVQDLVNAINADTTVGAKAVVAGGVLEITDPQGRGNLKVSTTDTALGAGATGVSTDFSNPTVAGTGVNANEIVGSATGLASSTALTNGGVTSFTAGGQTFSFTAGATDTIGDLLAAINNPSDPAGLQAYIGDPGTTYAGQLVVVDPGNHSDVTVGPTNTESVLGSYTNAATVGTSTTDIFLSDSTAIGASTISVSIPALGSANLDHGASKVSIAADSLTGPDQTTAIANAKKALTDINQAVANVAAIRGDLGAGINRLQSAVNVINTQTQNLTSAEDGIRSADIATEVANLTKFSILNQTGISALAQANTTQQQVLALLR
ncbi:MAG TPA: flagellin [Terriglobales bacterium]|nr:flagellin [Terriglobales bacterium]